MPRLDLKSIGSLTFGVPDPRQFPCLGLALEAGRKGGTYPAVLAAADEIAVQNFLAGHVGFLAIAHAIDAALNAHHGLAQPTLDEVLRADTWARGFTEDWVKARA